MATGSHSGAAPADVEDLVVDLHQTSRQDVTERWNIIQRILARVEPSTEVELALLEAMNEMVDMTGGVAPLGAGDDGSGAGVDVGPGEGTLEDIAHLLSLQVRGFVDTRDLPIGATGRSVRTIPNGDDGIGVFQVAGNNMAVPVRAESDIEQFDQIRVVQGPGNTVTPIPAEDASAAGDAAIERVETFDVSVDAGEDILNQSFSPKTSSSSLLVGVVLDTAAEFRARVFPDDEDVAAFDAQFNARASTEALDADSLYQFDHDFGSSVELNYRVDTNGVTVRQLRVVETIRS